MVQGLGIAWQVAEAALQKAAQRKAMAKAVAKCAAGPQQDSDNSKRSRQQTTPVKFATPTTKTPDAKHFKGKAITTPKKLFEGAYVAT